MAIWPERCKMLQITEKVVPEDEWGEAAKKNAEDIERLRQFLINESKAFVRDEQERRRQMEDVKAGKVRCAIKLGIGIVINSNCTEITFNRKKKKLRKGDQKQLIIERLAEASKQKDYMVSNESLQAYLLDNWSLATERGVNNRTIQGVRDSINRELKEKIICSEKGFFWLNRNLLEI